MKYVLKKNQAKNFAEVNNPSCYTYSYQYRKILLGLIT